MFRLDEFPQEQASIETELDLNEIQSNFSGWLETIILFHLKPIPTKEKENQDNQD